MGDEVTVDPAGEVRMGTSVASGAATGAATGSAFGPWGTAIGAGIGALGGAFSNYQQGLQADKGYGAQREALQNSISWRVADAKRAGIHPLYAIGAPPMNITPMMFEDKIGPSIQQMGQSIHDIANRPHQTLADQFERFEAYKQMIATTDKTNAEAEYYKSLTAKNAQPPTNINPPGLGVRNELQDMGQHPTGAGQGYYENKPAESISSKTGKPWSSAGKNPGYQLRMLDDGLPAYLPIAEGDSPEETISEMSMGAWTGLLAKNSRIFGPGWMKDMINSRYLGIKPTGHYDVNKDYSERKWPRNAIGQKYNPEGR